MCCTRQGRSVHRGGNDAAGQGSWRAAEGRGGPRVHQVATLTRLWSTSKHSSRFPDVLGGGLYSCDSACRSNVLSCSRSDIVWTLACRCEVILGQPRGLRVLYCMPAILRLLVSHVRRGRSDQHAGSIEPLRESAGWITSVLQGAGSTVRGLHAQRKARAGGMLTDLRQDEAQLKGTRFSTVR